jgi:hypothetical protein
MGSDDGISHVIVVSDIHAGCQYGLCPPGGITLDGGGHYDPSALQLKVWEWWREYWDSWVPKVTRGKRWALVLNGDTTDGRHHNSTTQISQNLADQKHLAEEILFPITEKASALFMLRGTDAHVGQSGENEEMLAESLKAKQDEVGNYSRNEMWMMIRGGNGCLVHFAHTIGTTGSMHYESTAPMKELSEAFSEAGRWNDRRPDVIVRSHRHRSIKIEVPTDETYGIAIITPGWQLKTPFVYKIAGGRMSTPQFGGILICKGDEEHYTRSFVRSIKRSATEVL